jgi:hypothetical protein
MWVIRSPQSALAAQVRASRVAWASNPTEIAETIGALGRRALARSGGDGARAEAIFEGYLSRVSNRLENAGSRFGVEWQPAALADGTRVPGYLFYGRAGEKVFHPFGTSRRLDAGIIDLTKVRLYPGVAEHPVIHGFDITVDMTKPNIVPYYQEYFGPIPIDDIRLPR